MFKRIMPIKAEICVDPPWERRTKVYINSLDYMAKLETTPMFKIVSKTSLLQNQKILDLETWCEASMNGALQTVYK